MLCCYNCYVQHFKKLDFNCARDQHIASFQFLSSKRTDFCLFQCQIECKVAILLSWIQSLAKYLSIFIYNTFLAYSANFWAGMLALQWFHLIFLLLLSLFLFFHFATFFQFLMAKMTSNGDNSIGLTGRHSDCRAKQVYRNKIEFSKNFPQVLVDFWPRMR